MLGTISTILKRGYVEKRDKEGTRRDFRVFKLQDNQVSKLMEQENTGARFFVLEIEGDEVHRQTPLAGK